MSHLPQRAANDMSGYVDGHEGQWPPAANTMIRPRRHQARLRASGGRLADDSLVRAKEKRR